MEDCMYLESFYQLEVHAEDLAGEVISYLRSASTTLGKQRDGGRVEIRLGVC